MGGCRPAVLLSLLVCTGLRPSEAFELRRGLRRSSPGLVTWKVVSRAVAKRCAPRGKSRPRRLWPACTTRAPTNSRVVVSVRAPGRGWRVAGRMERPSRGPHDSSHAGRARRSARSRSRGRGGSGPSLSPSLSTSSGSEWRPCASAAATACADFTRRASCGGSPTTTSKKGHPRAFSSCSPTWAQLGTKWRLRGWARVRLTSLLPRCGDGSPHGPSQDLE